MRVTGSSEGDRPSRVLAREAVRSVCVLSLLLLLVCALAVLVVAHSLCRLTARRMSRGRPDARSKQASSSRPSPFSSRRPRPPPLLNIDSLQMAPPPQNNCVQPSALPFPILNKLRGKRSVYPPSQRGLSDAPSSALADAACLLAPTRVVLASASPRRKEILESIVSPARSRVRSRPCQC